MPSLNSHDFKIVRTVGKKKKKKKTIYFNTNYRTEMKLVPINHGLLSTSI